MRDIRPDLVTVHGRKEEKMKVVEMSFLAVGVVLSTEQKGRMRWGWGFRVAQVRGSHMSLDGEWKQWSRADLWHCSREGN